jgi:hypothetical protein
MLELVQIHLVAQKLAGADHPVVRPRDLTPPWAELYTRLQPLDDLTLAGRVLWETLAAIGITDPATRNQIADQVFLSTENRAS